MTEGDCERRGRVISIFRSSGNWWIWGSTFRGEWLFLPLNFLCWFFLFLKADTILIHTLIQSFCTWSMRELGSFTVSISGFSCARDNTNLCRNAVTSMWRVLLWSLWTWGKGFLYSLVWCWMRVFVNLLIERRTRWAGMAGWDLLFVESVFERFIKWFP